VVVLAGQRSGQRRTSGTDTAVDGGFQAEDGGAPRDLCGGASVSGGGAPTAGHHLHPYSLINLILKIGFVT
jgi:hypothetical protein